MNKQCDNFKGCNSCGKSFIDELLITRLGFTREQAEKIKIEAKKMGVDPVKWLRMKATEDYPCS
ncbi:MAG: hypothetical protein KJO69_01645 [Gammaproteobacteria bacterium]|nr:hypothetical protein [Gammaproteobacteria bacterium]